MDHLLIHFDCYFEAILENTLQISFLILSITFGAFWNALRPSPLYKPISFLLRSGSWFNKYDPTSAQVSAPSKEPIQVTSNEVDECFLLHGVSSLNNSDCLVWKIVFLSSAEMSVQEAAKVKASLRSLYEMDG